jgi:hypothetical protein
VPNCIEVGYEIHKKRTKFHLCLDGKKNLRVIGFHEMNNYSTNMRGDIL